MYDSSTADAAEVTLKLCWSHSNGSSRMRQSTMPHSRYQSSVISGRDIGWSHSPCKDPRACLQGSPERHIGGPRLLHMWPCRSMTVANGDLHEQSKPDPKPMVLKRPNSAVRHDVFAFVSPLDVEDGSTSSTYTVPKCCCCCCCLPRSMGRPRTSLLHESQISHSPWGGEPHQLRLESQEMLLLGQA